MESLKHKCYRCELEFISDLLLEDLKDQEFICRDCYIDNFMEGLEAKKVFGRLGELALRYKGRAWITGIANASFNKLLNDQLTERAKAKD